MSGQDDDEEVIVPGFSYGGGNIGRLPGMNSIATDDIIPGLGTADWDTTAPSVAAPPPVAVGSRRGGPSVQENIWSSPGGDSWGGRRGDRRGGSRH